MQTFSQCLISFGSNLGNRDAVIADAARAIIQAPFIETFRTSRLFETPAIGGPGGQEPFLNAIAALDTRASAREILALLQSVEEQLGRQRKHRWGARSIDLDVVLHGELVGGGRGLIVPHPRYTARQFVLQPACDVAAEYRDPRFGWTLRQLTDHLSAGAPSLALIGGDLATRLKLCERLATEHGIRVFADRDLPEPMSVLGNVPAGGVPFITSGDVQGSSIGLRRLVPDAIHAANDAPWVSAFVPPLPPLDSPLTGAVDVPRLVARLQWSTAETRWPAPHQMWPTTWQWPEYRLEIDDLDWTVGEIVSALDSMRCEVRPVTESGDWY